MAKAKKRAKAKSISNVQETLSKLGTWVEDLVSSAMPSGTAKPKRKATRKAPKASRAKRSKKKTGRKKAARA